MSEKEAKEVKEIADYLLDKSKSGLRARAGKLRGQRVTYFKGKSAINSVTRPSFTPSQLERPASRDEAAKALQKLIDHGFIVPVTKDPNTFALHQCQDRTYTEGGYYFWIYQGSQIKNYIMGFMVLAVIFAGVLFPLWPPIMRDGAWYLSMAGLGFLGFLFVLTIIRFIFYIITKVVASPGIWIFPNLYEDVGFFESFVPLYAWDLPPPPKTKGKGKIASERQTSADLPLASDPLLVEADGDANANANNYEEDEIEEIVADRK